MKTKKRRRMGVILIMAGVVGLFTPIIPGTLLIITGVLMLAGVVIGKDKCEICGRVSWFPFTNKDGEVYCKKCNGKEKE